MFYSFLIILISISYVFPVRFGLGGSLFLFDVFIAFFVIFGVVDALLAGRRTIALNVFNMILVGAAFLLTPFMLLIFNDEYIFQNLMFLSQYLFLIIVMPAFLGVMTYLGLWKIFFSSVFVILLLRLVLYMLNLEIYPTESRFGSRLVFGEFTPNESVYYLAFLTILVIYFKGNVIKEFGSSIVKAIFVFTESKTVFLSLIISFYSTRRWIVNVGAFIILFVALLYYSLNYSWWDWSPNTYSNSKRIEMSVQSLEFLPKTVLNPLYHAGELYGLQISSVHNVFLSIFVNFGVISGCLFLLVFLWLIVRQIILKRIDLLKVSLILLVGFMLNPLINARVVWLPFYVLVYFSLVCNSKIKVH